MSAAAWQMVQVQTHARVAGMAAPGGLADHMAIVAKHRLGQGDQRWQVEKRQPQRVPIEDALVVFELPW